jgi:ABC-type phosphate/phosphonate transport system substrate-binding protein
MIASLGMYDLPPLRADHDALWTLVRDGLRARGMSAPDALTRGEGAYWRAWQDPSLVLSQTCGYPFRTRLHGQVTLVGTPDFAVPGCAPGYYCSVYVVRSDDRRARVEDFDGAALAWNEALSQSGWAAPNNDAARRGIAFRAGPETGAHAQSARAVAEGRADIAALDAVTWTLLTGHGLAPAGLRVLDTTPQTPGLPYVAGPGADGAAVFDAVAAAIAALPAASRARLHLRGIVRIPAADYLAVPNPPPPARSAQPG